MKRPSPELIDRYINNQCSLEEADSVLSWFGTPEGQAYYDKYLMGQIEAQKESLAEGFQMDEQGTLESIYQRIHQHEKADKKQVGWLKVAAAVSLLLVSAWLLNLLFNPGAQSIETAYGETKTIELKDGTRVVLNANSQIKYHEDQAREIWLDGEAFFDVAHTKDDAPFSVHTEDLIVNVLGTEFNVNTRRKKTDVVLSTGKVRLDLEKNTQRESLLMVPGDKISYSHSEEVLEKKVVNPEYYTSWANGNIVFDHTPLSEVLLRMEDTYGVSIIVKDSSVLQKEISGEVVQDLEVLMTLLEKTFEIKLTRKESKIYLE